MAVARGRWVLGTGASAAVWAAITFAPTDLAQEAPPEAPPGIQRAATTGSADALIDRIDETLATRIPSLSADERERLAVTIAREAEKARLDPMLVLAVIAVESGFDVGALSCAGAKGLMQLRAPTMQRELRRHGLDGDPGDPVMNVLAGVRYLHRLVKAFGHEDLALMAYNAGPNRILGYLRAGEIPERFRVYPRRVRAELHRLRRGFPVVAPALAASHVPFPESVTVARAAEERAAD
jgi:soluble lytic murein transglycosylase-like protein